MNQSDQSWKTYYQSGRDRCRKGYLDDAIKDFQAAIQSDPKRAEVYHDLGVAFFQKGDFNKAFDAFWQAVGLDQQLAAAWSGAGIALCALNRLEAAIAWFNKALRVVTQVSDLHYNLANTAKALDRIDQAKEHYRKAVSLDKSHAESHNNLGTILLSEQQLDQALSCFETALSVKPSFHEAAYNAAMTLQRLGRLERALDCARQALQIKPDYGDALALLVTLLQQACDWESLGVVEPQLEQLTLCQLAAGVRTSEQPFLSFSRSADPKRNYQVAGAWSRWLMKKWQGRMLGLKHRPRRSGEKRITVGYLSEQFRNAATAHLTADLFERHDRDKFKIIAYSWGADDGSTFRRRIVRHVDQFVDIRAFTDIEAAQRIHRDEVDILIDLMGWMHGHRMGILLQRPAPIQVNYLGYPGTTGAPFMDYILADAVVAPSAHQPFFSEQVVCLPHSYQVTDGRPEVDDHAVSRASMGLPTNGIIFGAFNTDYKIEPLAFDCWMEILRAVPDSAIWLIVRSPLTKENLRREAQRRDVDPHRLIFADPLPKAQHLARLRLADMALDTFTVNGHTTTSDMLQAGVPVITLEGTHFASRVAASLLKAIGMNELITADTEQYRRLAIELALNRPRLAELKSRLAHCKASEPLFDTDRMVRNLERAYSSMWQVYCSGRPAVHLMVEDKLGAHSGH